MEYDKMISNVKFMHVNLEIQGIIVLTAEPVIMCTGARGLT